MKTIPAEVIEPIMEKVFACKEAESKRLVARFMEEQPFLMMYLMAQVQNLADDPSDDSEEDIEEDEPEISAANAPGLEMADPIRPDRSSGRMQFKPGESPETLGSGGDLEPLQGMILTLGMAIFQVMHHERRRLTTVSPERIQSHEEQNMATVYALSEDFTPDQFLSGLNQRPLVQEVLDTLLCGYMDDPESMPMNIGVAMVALKTVVDCLDQ